MFFSNSLVIALATLLASVTATPVPQALFPDDGIYRWKVEALDLYCPFTPTCEYKFTVGGDAFNKNGTDIPTFNATCSGTKESDPFVPCTFNDGAPAGRTLSSRIIPTPIFDERGKIRGSLIISYQFTDASKQAWNYTNNFFEVKYLDFEPQNFNVEVGAPVKIGPQTS
ncbi:hypothetical protein HYALB_00013704 [Hymenoscyphus albidus]|uniref:Uncharacterized protein n=1 Tax=Hymenoscyphus albidus TaxID=595503 RepID=A0A9N9M1D5_9HELO|nr:hypothetical protein HYALB_00013704 [Hymenoscyphus albidus]